VLTSEPGLGIPDTGLGLAFHDRGEVTFAQHA
jgi:hypothetical protein